MSHKRLLLLGLIIVVSSVSSCKGGKNRSHRKHKKFIPLLNVLKVEQNTFVPEINSVAYAKPYKEVILSVERPGKLLQLNGESGDYLLKNHLVARVRSLGLWSQRRGAKARINEIKASLNQSKSDFSKIKRLRSKGAISQNEFEMAQLQLKTRKLQLKSAKASLSQIQENLFGTAVFAAFSGEIAAKFQNVGNFVGMGTPLLKVVDLHKIKVSVGVSEILIPSLRIGDKVEVRAIAYPGKKWEGRIVSISPMGDEKSGAFPVEIEFTNTPDKFSKELVPLNDKGEPSSSVKSDKWHGPWMIKAGMTLKIRLFKPAIKGIFIPVEAVLTKMGKKYVNVVKNPENKTTHGVEIRKITVVDSFEGWVRVGSGLLVGENIVLTGSSRLRKDSLIRIRLKQRSISLEVGEHDEPLPVKIKKNRPKSGVKKAEMPKQNKNKAGILK